MRILKTGAFFLSGIALAFIIQAAARTPSLVQAQAKAAATIAHVFTSTDGQSHVEELSTGQGRKAMSLLPLSGAAELHWSKPDPAASAPWHTERQRMYVVTLRGHGEIEVAGGEKVLLGPGKMEFVEDLTGKGHISRATGIENRVALWLPLADQVPPAPKPIPGPTAR